MTENYRLKKELRRMYRDKEIIPLCCYPNCKKHRVNDEWIDFPKRDYNFYSHTLCPEHLEEALRFNHLKNLEDIKNE
jgi:hypothetical protein